MTTTKENGTMQKAEITKAVKAAEKLQTSTPLKVATKQELVKVPTVADRIKKIYRLQKMSEMRTELQETLSELDAFRFSSDRHTDWIEIRDTKGNTFKTSHTEIIQKVVGLIKGEVETKIQNVDNDLLIASI